MGKGTGSDVEKIGAVINVAMDALAELQSDRTSAGFTPSTNALIRNSKGEANNAVFVSQNSLLINQDAFSRQTKHGYNYPSFYNMLMEEAIHRSSNFEIRDRGSKSGNGYAGEYNTERIAKDGAAWGNAANYVEALGF